VRRIGGVVEAPDGGDTFLTVLGEGGCQWVVIEAFEHFLAFSVLIVTSALW